MKIARLRFRLPVLLVSCGLALAPAHVALALTNNLALTPPMGWNSWNHFGCNVSDALLRGIADAMVTNGLQAAGYQYVNIDDCWQVARDANGVIVPDPVRFPYGIKGLADYVHSKGLKQGVYSDHGYATCGGRPGGYGYEYLDANTYAAWGVDYLKYDNCNWPAGDNWQTDYFHMSDALLKCGRPIVFSICAGSFVSWMPEYGNLWRTTTDINDSFSSMVANLEGNAPPAFLAGPGRWNDPDMLEVGNGGMTFTEDQAHFSLWCVVGAPLIAGNDLTTVSAQTLSILTNGEAIAVDQDPAGEQGIPLPGIVGYQVWVKPLGFDFTTKAVALFNTNAAAANLSVAWTNIGLRPGPAAVRDLWAHADLGTFVNGFATNVPSHGVVLLRVVGAAPLPPSLGTNYLSDLQPAYAYVGWGTMTNNKSIGGNTLTLNGVTYAKGLGVHAFSGVEFQLGGLAARFLSDIGVDDEVGANGTVVFEVLADGRKIFDSGSMTGGAPHQSVNLDVTGVNRLTLGVTDADEGINYDHADWAGARVIVSNATPAAPATPAGLSASAGNPISLSWNPSLGAASYVLKRATATNGVYAILTNTVLTVYQDSSTAAGVTYYYTVAATNSFGQSAASAPVGATACWPPAAPTGVTAVPGNGQVVLSWSPVAGAATYSLARALSSTPFSTLASGLTTTNYTDTGLTNGVVYQYVVAANNACAQGSPSAAVPAVPNVPPPPPSGLTATPGGPGVALDWTLAGGGLTYVLKRATHSAGPYAVIATNLIATPYLDAGLAPGVTCFYTVSAVNSAVEGPDSPWVSATPCAGLLPAGWSDEDIGSVGLAGSAAACGASFIIQGGGADIWNTADAFHFASTTLSGDGALVARVTALTDTDPWAKAGLMYRADITAGSMFVDLIVSAASGVSLQWRSAANGGCNATTVSTVAAPAWVKLARSGANFTGYYSTDAVNWALLGTANVSLASSSLAGLAVTAHNNSSLCLAAFDYVSTAAPPAPTGLTAAPTDAQVTLTWNAVAGAVTYNVKRALASAGPYTTLAAPATAIFVDTNVLDATTYYYEVSAVNPLGESADSSPPLPVTLLPPSLSAVVRNDAVVLSWPASAAAYSLLSVTNLTPPTTWRPVTNASVSAHGQVSVTIYPTGRARFFRLVKP